MKYRIILTILVFVITASAVLTFVPIEQACGISANGCYAVQTSQYETTFGMKNSHVGFVAFIILFIVNYLHIKRPSKKKKQFLITGLALGSVIAIYFMYLQFFVLHAICKYCMIADVGTILSLIVAMVMKEKPNA